MKTLKHIINSCFLLSVSLTMSCSTPAEVTNVLSVDSGSVQLGTNQNGVFTKSSNNKFSNKDKIFLHFNSSGLTVVSRKIKVNIDLFLKKDQDILGSQTDILGKDGLSQDVTAASLNPIVTNGTSSIEIAIQPPSDTKGDLSANVTLKDLNTSGKIVSFVTKFTLE